MNILVILAHGIFGWGDKIDEPEFKRAYFYGFRDFVEKEYGHRSDVKFEIVAPTVTASESIDVRGGSLKEKIKKELEKTPGARAHIIAHSMGGLDARWAIAAGGMMDDIASLTTIGTPHQGTTLADQVLGELQGVRSAANVLSDIATLAQDILKPFGKDSLEFYHHLLRNIDKSAPEQIKKGVEALTLKGAEKFNHSLEKAEKAIRARANNRVEYFAYGGRPSTGLLSWLNPSSWKVEFARAALGVSGKIVKVFGNEHERGSGNDGAVSVWSAHYPWDDPSGKWDDRTEWYEGTISFNHFWQTNWRIPERRADPAPLSEDLAQVYRTILNRIVQVQQAQ